MESRLDRHQRADQDSLGRLVYFTRTPRESDGTPGSQRRV